MVPSSAAIRYLEGAIMLKRLGVLCLGLASVAAVPLMAQVQGISATGTSEISHPAASLRMQVDITAEGRTIADALTALKAKRESLTAQLGKLGAAADSVTYTSPRLYVDPYQQARRMEQMMQARMNGGKAAKAKPEEKVTVAATAKAQWALKGTSDEVLARSYDLKKSLEESLKSKSASSSATPTTGPSANAAAEEEEAAEESSPQYQQYDNGEIKPGNPVFVYVAQITPEEREKALANAMAKAREQAAQAAKAAGVQLGSLHQLSQHTTSGATGMEYGYNQGMSRVMYQMMNSAGMQEGASEANEAIGPDMASVKLVLVIQATWEIKQ